MAKRETPEVNAGSMADIAFLLLIFFLVTTTMSTDTGLARRLPPPVPDEEIDDTPPIKDRNVFTVLLNSKNQLLVKGKPMKVEELKDATKEFILNPNRDEKLPEFKTVEVENFRTMEISKGVISLQNDNGTQYQAYLMVQNELQRAYTEVRNEFTQREWGKDYEELEKAEQKIVRTIYPQRISEAEPKNIGK